MNLTRHGRLAIFLCWFSLTGCSPVQPERSVPGVREPEHVSRRYLEDFCSTYGHMVEHNQFFAFVDLKPGVKPDEFARDVLAYLRGHGQLQSFYLSDGASDGLRQREFWALVLADLRAKSLELYGFEDRTTRDQKVEALLATQAGPR